METKTVFPVFGDLHADDSPALVIPSAEPTRKVYENTAKLCIVSAEQAEPSDEEPEEETESLLLKVTGDVSRDSIAALYCLAYLADFFAALEPGDIRKLADLVGVQR